MPLSAAETPGTIRSSRTCERYAMRVGGVTVGVESVSGALRLKVDGDSRLFLVDDETPDLALSISVQPFNAESGGDLLFDSGGVWRLYERAGRHVYRFFDRSAGSAPYKEAWLTPGLATGEVFLNPAFHSLGATVDVLQFPLDELLLLRLLAEKGGIELHSSGVISPSGKGYLFAGQSGDGKTTTARLWEQVLGASVLSDDRIVLRYGPEGTWWMYGTPWHGEAELAANARAPLAAVFVLEHGEENGFEKLSGAGAVSSLLARSFLSFHSAAPLDAALGLLDKLVGDVPCLRFSFVPGPDAVRFVLENAPQGGL